MSNNIGAAQLAITTDVSGVETGVSKAKKTLATLGSAAKVAGTEAAKGTDKIGEGADKASQKLDRATKQAIASIQRQTAAFDAGGRSSSKFWESIANQRGLNLEALKPYLAQLDAASAKQSAMAAAAKAAAPAITQVGMSARQVAAAIRGVPAQFTDIATSLAGGQSAIQVFLQQGGQLKDMFGGIGPAARALGGYVVGLINPLSLAAAAVGVLGLAYFQGSREADGYAKAIILTGNAAGKTAGQLQMMAERIAGITGTQSAAADALAQFVSNGTIAGESIERFTVVALRMEKLGGQAVAETVKQFAELGKSPVEASSKLNEATNFLTRSVAAQIRMLEEQGKVAEAAAVAQKAYADALESRLPQIEGRLGTIERAWEAVKSAAKGAWDAMLNVGRQDSLDKQLAEAQDRVAALERHYKGDSSKRALFDIDNARQAVAVLAEQQRLLKRGAEAKESDAAQVKAQLAFDKAGDQFLSKKAKMEREIAEARATGLAAGKSQIEIDKRIADIREKYTDKGAARSAARLGRAEVGLDIERIRGEGEKLIAVYSSSERRIDTLRQAGILSDREYYEAKRAFINLESQAKEEALSKELARLNEEKLSGADKLLNDKKIADAEARLAIVRAETSSKLEELSDRQVQATRREAAEFMAARHAAEAYFGATTRRQEFELSNVGQGRRQRDEARGSFDIQERYAGERQRMESIRAQKELMGTFIEDERRQYDQRLSLLDEFEAKELASWREFNQRKLEAEQVWTSGAQEALQNYADSTRNLAGDMEQVVGGAFASMEDALTDFVATGKLNFKSLANSIIADMARMVVRQQITGPLAGALSGSFGAIFSGGGSGMPDDVPTRGGRAIGGPVSAGGMYRVNERGPELLNVGGKQFLMMGSQPGQVSPTGSGSGAAAAPVTVINHNTFGDVASMAQVQAEMRQSERRTVSALRRAQNYGAG